MKKALTLIAAAVVVGGSAVLVTTDPAHAQTYVYSPNNVLGRVIDQLIGTRYGLSDRQAIRQCTVAAVNRAEAQYRPYYSARWRGPYQGYNGHIRVSGITEVRRRARDVRVSGLLETGLTHRTARGLVYRPGRTGDLRFRCDVTYRGAVRNLQLTRDTRYYR